MRNFNSEIIHARLVDVRLIGTISIMNIGEVSRASGLPIKTIRYYEDMGLIAPHRQENGYRVFNDHNLYKLKFLRRSRSLGFSVKECSKLLELYDDPDRTSAQVKNITQHRLSDIERKIEKLQVIRSALKRMVGSCRGSDDRKCAILDSIANAELVH